MTDYARFGIQIIDKFTAPARRAAAELDRIEEKLKKVGGRLSALSSKEVSKLAGHHALGAVGGVFDTISSKMVMMATYGAGALAALGAGVGAFVVKSVVQVGTFADATRRSFAALLGDATKGNEAFERIKKTAYDLGLDVVETTGQLQKMLAMQFSFEESEELIKVSADLQAVGTSAENVKRALIAITQIKAKGKLQSEELVGQLAEAGVSTVLVYQALARQLGKTEDQIKDMLKKGQISGDVGIAGIKEAIMHKVHEDEAGQAARSMAANTVTGAFQRLKAAPTRLWVRAGEAINQNFERMVPLLRRIEDYIDGIDGNRIAKFVQTVLEAFEKLVPLALEFASGFGEGFGEIVDAMQGFKTGASDMKTARDMGRNLAKFFGVVVELGMKLLKVIQWFGTPMGRWVFQFGVVGTLAGGLLGKIFKIRKGLANWLGPLKAAKTEAKTLAQLLEEAGGLGGGTMMLPTGGKGADKAAKGGMFKRMFAGMKRYLGVAKNFIVKWAMVIFPALWSVFTKFAPVVGRLLMQGLMWAGRALLGFFAGIPALLGLAIGAAVLSLANLAKVLYENWDELKASFEYLYDELVKKAKQLAGDIVDALKNGLASAGNWLADKFGFGNDTVQGTRGLKAELPQPKLSAQAAAAGDRTQTFHIDTTVNVNNPGSGEDGKKVGEQAGESFKDSIMDRLESMGLSMGT